ncbi:tetratricopeptide repeat protein [Streptomyces sp. NPDC047990]|uniref:tetratricopeptide repeat protein n=1 Tax=Streptomyces sp. NPDC047990 TaxID=3365496 RepID=UPI0037199997
MTVRLSGDPEQAREADEESLKLLREQLGSRNPLTLVCAANLALDLRATGAVQQAQILRVETIDRRRRRSMVSTRGSARTVWASCPAGSSSSCGRVRRTWSPPRGRMPCVRVR